MTDDGARPKKNYVVIAGYLTAVAWEFIGSIAAGAVIGHFADRYFGTAPWLLITLTLFGSCAGFFQMVRILRRFEKTRNV